MTRLAIVLVSYNSKAMMKPCLDSLLSQSDSPEIVVVDNQSSDGTLEWVRHHFSTVRTVEMGFNAGYGAAANCGIAASEAGIVMVANPDTVFEPGSVEQMVRTVQQYPAAFVMPKLVQPDGTINAVGLSMHVSGLASCVGLGQPADSCSGVFPVLLLSGAVVVAHRTTWAKVGGFDPEIFMYMEDVELSLRARSMGCGLFCDADAVVEHDYSINLTPRKFAWLEQHRMWTLLKLLSVNSLVRLLPALILTSAATWAFAIAKGPDYVAARAKAVWWLMRRFNRLHRERMRLGRLPLRADHIILTSMTPRLPLQQLVAASLGDKLAGPVNRVYAALLPKTRAVGRENAL